MPIRSLRIFSIRNICHDPATVCFAGLLILAACTSTTTQSFKKANTSNVDASVVASDADSSKDQQLDSSDSGIFSRSIDR